MPVGQPLTTSQTARPLVDRADYDGRRIAAPPNRRESGTLLTDLFPSVRLQSLRPGEIGLQPLGHLVERIRWDGVSLAVVEQSNSNG